MARDFAWECECGNVEYSEVAPDECEKCFGIDSFTQLPEELLDERAKDVSDDLDLEMDVKKAGKAKVAKAKKKSPKGRKRK